MRILFAWEMGNNFGHATQIGALARLLKHKKADVWIALKNPAAAASFADEFPDRILQAPYHPVTPGRRRSRTYAEGLVPCGYGSVDTLVPLISAWRGLFSLVKPDILVTEAAPTALLASRGMKIKRMAFGRGFDVPPPDTPMPVMRYWEKHDAADIRRREKTILQTINTALERLRLKPLAAFREMMDTNNEFLCTFRELDHYHDREDAEYYGPLYTTDTGLALEWNKKTTKRIFAYLSAGKPFAATLEALRRLPDDYDVIVVATGIPAEIQKNLAKPSLRIIPGHVRLDRILPACDLVISNGNSGMCSAAALAGVPMLMLPLHVEQIMSARAVGRTGMGLSLLGPATPDDVSRKIGQILSDKKFQEAAKALAQKYTKSSPEATARNIVQKIMGKAAA